MNRYNMNLDRLKILTKRDLMYISESKLQELRNKGYIIEEECGSCNRNLGMDRINRIQSLTPTCPNTMPPYYNKKYYGLQYTANTVGPGLIKLESTPSGGTSPYTVNFFKDGSTTAMTGTTQPVPGITWQNWYIPTLADITTAGPSLPTGSHAFNSTVLDSCTGSTTVIETPCTMVIVDLGNVTANPTSVTIGAGQFVNVNLSYLDTVGTAYPTTFTGSVTQLLAQTPTMSGTLANYISLTGWNAGLIATGSVTISLLSGAPAGATGSVRLPVKVSTSTTTKYVDINVASCSTPVCNFSVN